MGGVGTAAGRRVLPWLQACDATITALLLLRQQVLLLLG